jgi:hypothetical protein
MGFVLNYRSQSQARQPIRKNDAAIPPEVEDELDDLPTTETSAQRQVRQGNHPMMGTKPPKPGPTVVAKTDKPAPVAAYDQNGKLVGIIMDPSKITPVVGGAAPGSNPAAKPAPAQKPAPAAAAPAAPAVGEEVAKLQKAARFADDPADRIKALDALNGAAAEALRRIHRRPVPTGLGSYIGR